MSAIIETQNLTHIYGHGLPDATTALEDVSFAVEEGDFVGIIGSTGSGKSTLISHFNGLLRPTSGRVLVAGEDIWADPGQIRRFRFMVGMVMQYPEYQLFEESVYKDIAFGPKNMGLDPAEIDRRVRAAAEFCGIPAFPPLPCGPQRPASVQLFPSPLRLPSLLLPDVTQVVRLFLSH